MDVQISHMSDVVRRLLPNGIEEFEAPGLLVRMNNSDTISLDGIGPHVGKVVLDEPKPMDAGLRARRGVAYQMLCRLWHPEGAKAVVINQDKSEPAGSHDTHAGSGGRRGFAPPVLLDAALSHQFGRVWAKECVEFRPFANSVQTQLSGSKRIWADGWSNDKKSDGWNCCDPEHLQVNAYAQGVLGGSKVELVSRLPEVALHLHARTMSRLFPIAERNWHSKASRAVGWRCLQATLNHLCGLNDSEQLGLTPRQECLQIADQLAHDPYTAWGDPRPGKAMPIPEPSDYGWHEGVLGFGAQAMIQAGILPPMLQQDLMDWLRGRADWFVRQGLVDQRGVSRSFTGQGGYDADDLARYQALYSNSTDGALNRVTLELSVDGVIREAPRQADSELCASWLAFCGYTEQAQHILALHPPMGNSADDVEPRYLNPARALLQSA